MVAILRKASENKPRNQLSDGRAIRPLPGRYTQEQMFGLHKRGLFDPATEKIMGVKEHDDSLNVSNVWEAIYVRHFWRTGRYAAYRRGFEKEDLPVGDTLIYFEKGIAYTLEIPDVPVEITKPDGKSEIIGLRTAVGMIDFDVTKLTYDPEARVVSVASDFNPWDDVRVIDIMRPEGWALVDANGYPLRSKPARSYSQGARKSSILYKDTKFSRSIICAGFEINASGYHGSVIRGMGSAEKTIFASFPWSFDSAVGIVECISEKRIQFDELHSQNPYRDAPRIIEDSRSGDSGKQAHGTRTPGMLKRLSNVLGFG
jgi:hypothetical protein